MRNRPYQVLKCSSSGACEPDLGAGRLSFLSAFSRTWSARCRRPKLALCVSRASLPFLPGGARGRRVCGGYRRLAQKKQREIIAEGLSRTSGARALR